MRYTWKGLWRKGEITMEAESLEELTVALDKLFATGEVQESNLGVEISTGNPATQVSLDTGVPTLPSGLGATNAVRALLSSEWGKQPRSMKDIEEALKNNALYFSKGTLSGTLTLMTKAGSLRRFQKDGKWVYVIK